ncbi:phage tail tape measure C-terminal domain-containing protein [Shumkonia mesophila]|uniref:phage tail tape measure C-terminal domain-containing protein n=1 Tax=Shumkonia mesophila TaxID=2838854 RepID=UPI002934E319|nr:phage tail tape measure C-terminal domain-containing protein [Shumkonia mesophila]
MTELTLAVRLTADGDGLVGAVKVSREELEKLGRTASDANRSGAKAADEHGRSMKGVRDQVRETSPAMAEMTGQVKRLVAAWLSFETVKFVIAGVVRETTNAEKISARLDAVLKATGQSAGYTREQLDRLADAMARTTLFDDDTARQGIAVMSTFRSVQGEAFREAIELSADLAALMGGDLQSAILQVGKALEEPVEGITALRRSGISFSQSQREMIRSLAETGRVAEAQRIVLDGLRNQIGGVAGAQNNGMVGAITDMTKAWDDFLEALGRTPVVQKQFSNWTMWLGELRSLLETGSFPPDEWYENGGRTAPPSIGDPNATPTPAELNEAQRTALRNLEQQTALIGRSALAEEQMKALKSAGFRPTVGAGGDVTVEDFEKIPGVFQDAVGEIKRMVAELNADAFGQRAGALQRGIDTADDLRISRALGPEAQAERRGIRQGIDVAAEARIVDPEQISQLGKLFAAQEKANRELALTEQLYDDLRGPQEAYAERLRIIELEYGSGGITAAEMGRATRAAYLDMLDASEEWQDGVTRGILKVADEAGDMAQNFEDLTVGSLRKGEDAWVNWAKTGRLATSDLFDFIGEEALRLAYRMAIVKPFLEPLADAFGGWLRGLGGNSMSGAGGTSDGLYVNSNVGHEGGQIGGPNAFRPRAVPASLFEGAPRMHGGGQLGADEVPFIGKKGEVVGWPSQMREAFGGGAMKIELINQGGTAMKATDAQESRGPNGERVLRVWLREEMQRGLNEGQYDGAMRSNFGVGRAPAVRRG